MSVQMRDWIDLDRREFLGALGAAYGSVACTLGAPQSRFIEYAVGEDGRAREQFVLAMCPMCPGGCGLTVRVVHGCAVGVRGNKEHPVNRGGLCSRASAVLQDVYNPDRLRAPLRCVGGRGSGEWERISWDRALEIVADRLARIRREFGPHGLCVVVGRDRGLTRVMWERFTRSYGSPNLIDGFPDDNLGVLPVALATHGVRQRFGYDLSRANYVLSFNSGWLDSHWSAEQAARAFAEFRRGRPGFRPRWVQVEPRHSLTATKADEWVPIRPGAEGALALGIAHVLLREGLYDRGFIDQHGYGFEDWTDSEGLRHLGFRRMVLRDFAPANVASVTGVAEGTIFRLAREFSKNRPAVALGSDGGGCGTPEVYSRMAIHCLNALVGSIDVPGGITVFSELSLLDGDFDIDSVAERGLSMPSLDGPASGRRLADSAIDALAESLQTGKPYRAEAVCLVDADPVFSLANGARFGEALSSVPFVVAFSCYHNDSNRHADLILPTLHTFHRWDFDVAHTLKGHPVVTVSSPVMPTPPTMCDPYGCLKKIANRLGGSIDKALPWVDAEQAVNAVCRELFAAGKGAPFGPANEEDWAQLLESRGWRAPFAATFAEFKRDVLAGGGWTDPMYFHREWDRVLRSPPQRFAFSSAYLAKSFQAMPDVDANRGDDRRCLPDCRVSPDDHDPTYPLKLYVYALPNLVGISSPNLPWINDIAGAYMFEKWRTWVEIHPETAEHLGLADGQHAAVRTPRGELVLPVKIYAGLMPGVIAIPFGLGHNTGGRWCEGIGENPAELIEARTDRLTGASLWTSTPASVRKV